MWVGMIQRCTNQNHLGYKYYGARGITVCDRWMVFVNFSADMGDRPSGKTLDRINNDGNYEPGNCRWATDAEQKRNNRNTRLLTLNGKTQCVKDWADDLGLASSNLLYRLKNWPLVEALTKPKQIK